MSQMGCGVLRAIGAGGIEGRRAFPDRLFCLAFIVLLLGASVAAAQTTPAPARAFAGDTPVFREEAAAAGIDHSYTGPWEFFVGGGGAALDCNGDRFPDVFLAGGKGPATVYANRSQAGGALAFEAVAQELDPKDLENVTGAYPLDVDQDGYQDLVVLRVGENLLLKGGPDCRFPRPISTGSSTAGGPGRRPSRRSWNRAKPFRRSPSATMSIAPRPDRPGAPAPTMY